MPYLWLTVFVELTGKALKEYPAPKTLMYNVFNGIEFVFYLGIFYLLNRDSENRRLLRLMIVVFLSFFLFNILFLQGFWLYNNQTTTVGAILIITTCLYEYFRVFSREEPDNILKWPLICIATGLIIFYAGNFPNNALLTQMMKTDSKAARMLYSTINNNLNVVLY
ncbi:MAG: hypothetical protein J7527_10395, partial [Chitinophagaceae bacterium]|nr:hypothetical protein [Chitinophagaceae bacterium]